MVFEDSIEPVNPGAKIREIGTPGTVHRKMQTILSKNHALAAMIAGKKSDKRRSS
jgi:hypothetical protein